MTSPAVRPAITHLLYLHGFRSAPQSTKARRMAQWRAEHRPGLVWACPQLPPSPADALRLVLALVAAWPRDRMAVIGSSLGGFYATAVAERLGCRAVLLNPAVDPARDLTRHLGEITAWHSEERFVFRAEFLEELRQMSPPRLTAPDRYLAIIAKGDEVLDWREMAARYAGCRVKLVEGGDHALTDFDRHLPDLLRFVGLD
jgi:predicted esterase YcpF (UPF0227 family)